MQDIPAPGQIYGYHIESGVVKINEARRQIGLPPIKQGELTLPELEAMLKENNSGNPAS